MHSKMMISMITISIMFLYSFIPITNGMAERCYKYDGHANKTTWELCALNVMHCFIKEKKIGNVFKRYGGCTSCRSGCNYDDEGWENCCCAEDLCNAYNDDAALRCYQYKSQYKLQYKLLQSCKKEETSCFIKEWNGKDFMRVGGCTSNCTLGCKQDENGWEHCCCQEDKCNDNRKAINDYQHAENYVTCHRYKDDQVNDTAICDTTSKVCSYTWIYSANSSIPPTEEGGCTDMPCHGDYTCQHNVTNNGSANHVQCCCYGNFCNERKKMATLNYLEASPVKCLANGIRKWCKKDELCWYHVDAATSDDKEIKQDCKHKESHECKGVIEGKCAIKADGSKDCCCNQDECNSKKNLQDQITNAAIQCYTQKDTDETAGHDYCDKNQMCWYEEKMNGFIKVINAECKDKTYCANYVKDRCAINEKGEMICCCEKTNCNQLGSTGLNSMINAPVIQCYHQDANKPSGMKWCNDHKEVCWYHQEMSDGHLVVKSRCANVIPGSVCEDVTMGTCVNNKKTASVDCCCKESGCNKEEKVKAKVQMALMTTKMTIMTTTAIMTEPDEQDTVKPEIDTIAQSAPMHSISLLAMGISLLVFQPFHA